MTFAIMLRPVLMEHEGQHHFVRATQTREEAKTWIAAQKDEYFKPGDYYVLESQA